jgi:hypothetical protein
MTPVATARERARLCAIHFSSASCWAAERLGRTPLTNSTRRSCTEVFLAFERFGGTMGSRVGIGPPNVVEVVGALALTAPEERFGPVKSAKATISTGIQTPTPIFWRSVQPLTFEARRIFRRSRPADIVVTGTPPLPALGKG